MTMRRTPGEPAQRRSRVRGDQPAFLAGLLSPVLVTSDGGVVVDDLVVVDFAGAVRGEPVGATPVGAAPAVVPGGVAVDGVPGVPGIGPAPAVSPTGGVAAAVAAAGSGVAAAGAVPGGSSFLS